MNNSQFVINYSFKLDSRKIDIIFVIEDEKVNHKKFDYYFKLIIVFNKSDTLFSLKGESIKIILNLLCNDFSI